MKYQTTMYTYKVINQEDYFIVVRECWLFGVKDKYLNRFGELEDFVNEHCKFSDEKVAEIRLVKYLKHLKIY